MPQTPAGVSDIAGIGSTAVTDQRDLAQAGVQKQTGRELGGFGIAQAIFDLAHIDIAALAMDRAFRSSNTFSASFVEILPSSASCTAHPDSTMISVYPTYIGVAI